MNRGLLRAALTARLGLPPVGDGLLTEPALNDCLQLGLNDLAEEHHWPWLISSATLTFTSGSAPFPTSPAVAHTRELVINGRRARRASSLSEYIDSQADGCRCVWFEVGNTVALAPIPASSPTSNTLYYVRQEQVFTADGQSPLLPEQFTNTLIARSAYHANTRRKNFESATQDQGEYQEGLKRMKAAYPARSGPRTIRPAGVSYWAQWA